MNLFSAIVHRLSARQAERQKKSERDHRRIWEASARTVPRSSPDTEAQWRKLERSLNREPVVAVRPRRRLVPRFAFAGSVATLIIIGLFLLQDQSHPERFQTARGEQLRILLPDSSEVVLNHTSTLTFERQGFTNTRSVAVSGEAFFSVRKTGSPFVVTTGVASIHVVGTEFNVRVRDDSYEVGVTEGIVQVTTGNGDNVNTFRLTKGTLVSGVRGTSPGSVERIGFADYPGWTHGKMMFARTSVEVVAKEIQDRFDVRIQIADAALRNVKITGVLEGSDARSVMSTLCLLTGRNQRYEDGSYILY
jgi:ferric-dicitrate binding protein FerR (iron transport regulator)